MNDFKIAVVTINYNGVEDSIVAIKSVQMSLVVMDIILIDNASANNKANIIEKDVSGY